MMMIKLITSNEKWKWLVIGKNITLADLKGTMEIMAKKIFNDDLKIRFRTSYFPFTEPSFEVDVSCLKCRNKKNVAFVKTQDGLKNLRCWNGSS